MSPLDHDKVVEYVARRKSFATLGWKSLFSVIGEANKMPRWFATRSIALPMRPIETRCKHSMCTRLVVGLKYSQDLNFV